MLSPKADIIEQLQKDILRMQGFKPASNGPKSLADLGIINNAFPNGCFPLGAVHEFLCPGNEKSAAAGGFIACLVSAVNKNNSPVVWIGFSQKIFPPALVMFGISPDKVIFINARNRKEVLWVMEESLKCEGLAAVIGELKEISFTESRRLQLAVEQSRVTGFIIREKAVNPGINACVSRWEVSPAGSGNEDSLPGIGFPRWKVALLKIRNGKPGSWTLEWANGQFRIIPDLVFIPSLQKRKAG